MEVKCKECNQWVDIEEYSYGHDCEEVAQEPTDEEVFSFRMAGNTLEQASEHFGLRREEIRKKEARFMATMEKII